MYVRSRHEEVKVKDRVEIEEVAGVREKESHGGTGGQREQER